MIHNRAALIDRTMVRGWEATAPDLPLGAINCLWMAIQGFNRSAAPLIVAITTEVRREKSVLSPANLAQIRVG